MKILLIFPPQTLEDRYSHNMSNVGGFLPPLGLCYMAAVLEQANHEVQIMDCPVNDYRLIDILKRIRSFQPDVVGLSALTSLAEITKGICTAIKKDFPSITILVGGPHATIMPEELAKDTAADIILAEEADAKIAEVVANLPMYKKMKIVQCGKVMDLDSLPFPARHLLDMKKYTSLPNMYKTSRHVFQMITARGCPYTCTFCFDARGKFRQRSVANVVGEIKHLIKEYQIKEIAFYDDITTPNKKMDARFL